MQANAGRILIADDARTNRVLLRLILQKEGYEIIEAQDGDEAVELARRESPHLVLSDVMMPRMDGYQVCRELKKDPATREIPVIFLSGQSRTEDKIMGLELGAADYIAKPFDKREVVARVRAQLRIAQLNHMVMAANDRLAEKQAHIDEALAAASTIQQSLLPRTAPRYPGVRFGWSFTPCEEVGGDIFNIHRVGRRLVAFYMLDVCGHGVPAAMITVSVCQTLSPQAGVIKRVPGSGGRPYDVASPKQVIEALDREYPFERFERHFTMCYGLLDIESGELRYGNAGHPAPIVVRRNGEIEELTNGGTIVGLGMADLNPEGTTRLEPGDRLYLYTDGIVEQQADDGGEFFGEKRLHQLLGDSGPLSLDATCARVVEEVTSHGRGDAVQDDVSLLGVEFQGRGRGRTP